MIRVGGARYGKNLRTVLPLGEILPYAGSFGLSEGEDGAGNET